MLQNRIMSFRSSIKWWLKGALKQQKYNFKLLALRVVAVAYERWSLTRGSRYSDLTWKRLVFCKTGRWGELIAYKRGSTGCKFQLYINYLFGYPNSTSCFSFLCLLIDFPKYSGPRSSVNFVISINLSKRWNQNPCG